MSLQRLLFSLLLLAALAMAGEAPVYAQARGTRYDDRGDDRGRDDRGRDDSRDRYDDRGRDDRGRDDSRDRYDDRGRDDRGRDDNRDDRGRDDNRDDRSRDDNRDDRGRDNNRDRYSDRRSNDRRDSGSRQSVDLETEATPRVLEVEDYLTRRAQDYLSVRFPQRPYSIVVHITPLREQARRPAGGRDDRPEAVSLPYLELNHSPELLDDWVRKDVPVEELLNRVKHIRVSLNVPGEVSDEELRLLRRDLYAKLRLDSGRDTLEISRREWAVTSPDAVRSLASLGESRGKGVQKLGELAPVVALCLLLLAIGLGWLTYLSRAFVSRLMQGLSGSLGELWSKIEGANPFAGRGMAASQAFLSASAEADGTDGAGGGSSRLEPSGASGTDVRAAVKDLLGKMQEMFADPQLDLLEVLEDEGRRHPGVVGGALLELDNSVVQKLFMIGHGDWWFRGLLDPDPLSTRTLEFLDRLNAVRNKRPFHPLAGLGTNEKKLALVLARLNDAELEGFFMSYPFRDALPALRLVRVSRALKIAKRAFPREWGALLKTPPGPVVLPAELVKPMYERALSLKPLRQSDEIAGFFKDLDLRRYLDLAPPSDERDIYQVLAPDSTIVRTRRPFFTILNLDAKDVALFTGVVTNEEWAVAMSGFESAELGGFLSLFGERQRYFVSEAIEACRARTPSPAMVAEARRKIMRQLSAILETEQQPGQTGATPATARAA